jgi:tetratricopeptide (TPR) repeat protein
MARIDSLRDWARPRAGLLGVLAITAVAYAASLRNGFVWDDWSLVVENPVYREFRLGEILFGFGNGVEYLPVKDLSLAFDAWAWGMRPLGFHLANVVLYLAGVAAVHAATRRLATLCAHPHAAAVASWTSLVFALHPLHAEVVNFVTARNTLLAGLFVFLALDAVLAGIAEGRDAPIVAGLVLFVLAAFSKAIVVFFPAFVVALLLVVPGAATRRRKLAISAAFLAAGAAVSWVHAKNAAATGMMSYDALRFGTGSLGFAVSKALQIPFFYLRLLVVPYPLSVEYDAAPLVSGPVALRAALGAAGIAAACAAAWLVRRTRPLVALGIAWFFLSLGPVANLFPTHPVVADRYAYLAVFGFGLVAAALAAAPLAAAGRRRAILLAPACVAALWTGVIAARSAAWRSDVALWEAAVAADPSTGRLALTEALWQAGRYPEALAQIREGRRRGGSYHASVYEGRFAEREGRLDDAVAAYERALAEGGDGDADVHALLGQLLERRGADRRALAEYLKAIETETGLTRRSGDAGRAGAERVRARYAPEIAALRAAAEAAPRDPAAHARLALALHGLGAYDEAEREYRTALDVGPATWQLWYNLGLTFMKRKRCEEAIPAFERALQLSGPNMDVLNNVGSCQMALRRYREAERTYLATLQQFPGFLFATFNLGRTYFVMGDRERALATLSRARALAGGDAALQRRIDQYLRQLD